MEERINPSLFLKHVASTQGVSIENFDISPVVIGSWDHNLIKTIAEELDLEPQPHWTRNSTIYKWKTEKLEVTFITLPVGAPSAVTTLEQLIACGAKIFIGIGFAGSLQPNLPVGSIVIADKCIREEGTSYHYQKDNLKSSPSIELLLELQNAFEREGVNAVTGEIWTTDAIFRELKSKIIDYGKRGVLGVEMETSAMYAVGKYRDIHICNILAISDELWSDWNPQFGSEILISSVQTIKRVLLNNLEVIITSLEDKDNKSLKA